jgi:predicted  nucleic acid-binding Zn-ribbon protein
MCSFGEYSLFTYLERSTEPLHVAIREEVSKINKRIDDLESEQNELIEKINKVIDILLPNFFAE